MTFKHYLRHWFAAFLPEAPHTRPREWLRAAFGAGLGYFISTWLCGLLLGDQAVLSFAGPLAASAVLVFAVSSGALAQPWSLVGSYLCASAVAVLVSHTLGAGLAQASLALALSLLLMCPLRCLHPPGGAVAFCMVLAAPALKAPVWYPIGLALAGAGSLLATALLYNNLTRVRYPRVHNREADEHLTRDAPPSERLGIVAQDLDRALEEVGEFVDITREDLEVIVRSTERHALRRGMADIRARDMMARDLVCGTPEMPVASGLRLLRRHHLKALPILDVAGRLVGIVSLSDLVGPVRIARARRLGFGFGPRRERLLGQLMSRPVRTVEADTHAVDLIPLLSDRGLHCLPVMENGALVGVITQTDLIVALHRDLLAHLG